MNFLAKPAAPMSMALKSLAVGLLVALSFAVVTPADAKVRVYNWSNYIDPQTIRLFKAETGIEVEYVTYNSDEEASAVLATPDHGYDLVIAPGRVVLQYLQRGDYERLEDNFLPNRQNMSVALKRVVSRQNPLKDYPPRLYSDIYMWGVTGIGINRTLAPASAPKDEGESLSVLFDPARLQKYAECGVQVLDAPEELISAALMHLGEDPASTDPAVLAKTEAVLMAIRPYIRMVNSSELIPNVGTGRVCFAFGWAGDIIKGSDAYKAVHPNADMAYYTPKEGARVWMDVMVISSKAQHKQEAYALYNFLMRPDIAARNTHHTRYANGNSAANLLISTALLGNEAIYPSRVTMQRLHFTPRYTGEAREVTERIWNRFLTGQ